MDYPIQSPGQLTSQLRALRKARGLNQAQLGMALGVGQTRIARIERDPTAISVEQFLNVLNILGVQMVLRAAGLQGPVDQEHGATRAPAKGRVGGRRREPDEPW
jgi:HTH-type transcriptional regulator/antitoxin HipB